MAKEAKTEPEKVEQDASKGGAPDAPVKRLARWQWVALSVAGAVTLLGAGLMLLGTGPSEANGQVGQDITGMVGGFAPQDGDPTVDPESEAAGDADVISPAVFRLGFSFVVGFAVAYALRTFVKISVVAIGVFVLGLFGLQYLGVVEVHWDALSGHYESARDYLAAQTSSFKDFMTGHLPSAGSAVAGMAIGFKKS